MHDPRVGRFFAIDPLASSYSFYSPYSFAGNKVILFTELEGLEEKLPWYLGSSKNSSTPTLTLGLHNFEPIPYNRKEYIVATSVHDQKSHFANVGIFILNSVGAAWNGLSSTWTDALSGKNLGDMIAEDSYNLHLLDKKLQEDGFKKTFSDPVLLENLTGGLITMYATRKIGTIKFPNKILRGIRGSLATNFYSNYGFKTADIISHKKGIDFNSPVFTKTYKKGTVLEQWSYIDKKTEQPKADQPNTEPQKTEPIKK